MKVEFLALLELLDELRLELPSSLKDVSHVDALLHHFLGLDLGDLHVVKVTLNSFCLLKL